MTIPSPRPVRPGPKPHWNRRYEARIAADSRTRKDAYALRYKSYHAGGHIPSNASQLFQDDYDELPSVTTIVVYQDAKPVGSIRTCLLQRDTPFRSPALDAYPEEVDAVMSEEDPQRLGGNFLEVNRMVRAPSSADDQGLVFMLLRLAGRVGQMLDFKAVVCCVRANHIAFYNRMRYVQIGPMRPYPGLTCEMALLKLSRSEWEVTRRRHRLMDPEAGPPGLLDGVEKGRAVLPFLHGTDPG